MTIRITRPEVEALIKERLQSGQFRDAEDVIFQALTSNGTGTPETSHVRQQAIERLRDFGKAHSLSLGGITIRQLREEARR